MLDAKPRIVEPGVVRAADLKQHYIDHQPARGDKAGNVGDIRWDYVIGAVRKMKTAGAGTTQRRNRDVRMLCRETRAKGQREENPERRTTRRLGVEQASQNHRLGRRFRPSNGLTRSDERREIERFGHHPNRSFALGNHAAKLAFRRGWRKSLYRMPEGIRTFSGAHGHGGTFQKEKWGFRNGSCGGKTGISRPRAWASA